MIETYIQIGSIVFFSIAVLFFIVDILICKALDIKYSAMEAFKYALIWPMVIVNKIRDDGKN